MSRTESGIEISTRDQQARKAPIPILSTVFDIQTEVNLEHQAKACRAIDVTPRASVTVSNLLHPEQTRARSSETRGGKWTLERFLHL
mmetsp:Transcript_13273/g.17360  ORF Transcript_13273/g.17360 Transcript_13273/m.17360 type:complete len:87 (+) Transcript_13273:463-723(+)